MEARLSGGFDWAPLTRPVRPGEPVAQSGTLRGLGGLVPAEGKEEGESRDPRVWKQDTHVTGIAALLAGDFDEAITALEKASGTSKDPRILSDLAAVLLERGQARERASDLVRALDLTERALEVAPDLPEARFNKALAIEKLGLREMAQAVWARYLMADPSSDWAREARNRMESLQAAGAARRRWQDDAAAYSAACAAGDQGSADAIARVHAQDVTEAVLNDLAKWAELHLGGDVRAHAVLRQAAIGAHAVSEEKGDRLLEWAVGEIEAATADPVTVAGLARAIQLFRLGRSAQDDLRAEEANRLLSEAVHRFRGLGSVLVDAASLYQLSSAYYLGSSPQYISEIDRLVTHARDHQFKFVLGRALWLRGMALGSSGRTYDAAASLDEAVTQLREVGFHADASVVAGLHASTWWMLGQAARAWDLQRQNFQKLDEVSDPRRVQAMLAEAALMAEQMGHPHAGLVLQQGALSFAERHTSTVDRCDAFIWLARSALDVDRRALAEQSLREAWLELSRVTDASIRARLDAELSLAEARLRLHAAPVEAERAADRAVSRLQGLGRENQLAEAILIRAQAKERNGDLEGASADYRKVLDLAERHTARVGEAHLRVSLFDTMAELTREGVRFELDRGRDRAALLLADRIRATAIYVQRSMQGSDPVDDVIARLRPHEAVVFFAVMRDRTVAWVLRTGAVEEVELHKPVDDLQREISAWREAVVRQDSHETNRLEQALSLTLLEPLLPAMHAATSVVIVPDGPLHLLAWGSLRIPATGRRWIEDVAIAAAPSLRSLLAEARRTDGRSSVLLLGNPALDHLLFPNLPDLPAAAREVDDLSALYPNARVLTGADATADHFLAEAQRASVIHIAAHGMSHPVDPERSALLLAPGGTVAPDGVLTTAKLRGQDMRHVRLAVLAACRSGDGPLSPSQGPLSIARTLLEDGAQAAVVSLWDLPDEEGTALTLAFHRHLAEGVQPMTAMQRAQAQCWDAPEATVRDCGVLQLISTGMEGVRP
ncbi:MAG TPA: CHAT domain-containing tetratricopeptide repeat protein [Candidatus Polarisedimenticolaceae bacterium]|nr:CHAT domain-containing tetratricopeptide repeat protein [Candidatus Polarisedimenticolaceae bacterium]